MQKMITLLLIACNITFSGCTSVPFYADSEKNTYAFSNISDYDTGFEIGNAIFEIQNNPALDKPAILVNQEPIQLSSIAIQKVYYENNAQTDFREQIYKMIVQKAVEQQADHLGIAIDDGAIKDSINQQISTMETLQPDFFQGFLSGLRLTKEEYIENQKMATYHTLQRDFLWQSVKNENEDEILFLTKQKDISYQDAIQSFYDEYTDKLIQQAKIQYLDTSICEFMKDYH